MLSPSLLRCRYITIFGPEHSSTRCYSWNREWKWKCFAETTRSGTHTRCYSQPSQEHAKKISTITSSTIPLCDCPPTPRKNELQRAQDPHTWPLRTNTGVRQSQNSWALVDRLDAQVDGQGCRDGTPALLETRTLESDPPSRQVPIRSNRTRFCSKRVVAQ